MSKDSRKRRDPRAERGQRRDSRPEEPKQPEQPAADEPAHSSARERRDPRSEGEARSRRGGQAARAEQDPGARKRRDPRGERAVRSRGAGQEAAGEQEAVQPVIIEEPAAWVLVVPDMAEGKPSEHDLDVLGGARTLADASGGAVMVLDRTGGAEGLGKAGADRVVSPAGTGGEEAMAALVKAAIETLAPCHVLFPDTIPGAGDLGRRMAAAFGEEAAVDVRWMDSKWAVSRGDGGRTEYYHSLPRFILLAPEAAAPHEGRPHEARRTEPPELPDETTEARVVDEGLMPIDPQTIPLAEAAFILSAGNGVKDWESFHRLSRTLGATEGGSREVCDAGHLSSDRQVGISGTLVQADCYLALGISGAIQHLQGITDCKHVIAVNTDPYAPIMKRADLAIVTDVQALMAALLPLME